MSRSSQHDDVCMTPTTRSRLDQTPAAASSAWAPPGSPSVMSADEVMSMRSNISGKRSRDNASIPSTPKEENEQAHNESIQEKIGNMAAATGSNALLGVLELLKVAGGVTLSTTGKIVAPPLHVTRTVLLPSLWAATKDYVAHKTPQRVKDWFRILSSSLYHLHLCLINTDRGKVFQSKVGTVGVDLLDCASSDASRQAFMDGMACLVKLSEALHTPETKALLEQLSILGCRVVDAASTGRAKQLLHDASECVWSGVELFADPAATLALAEVTAYLCYALEMENALHRPLSKAKGLNPTRRAQLRRDRNRFQNQTYVDPQLLQDPDATIEQAILSSIGPAGGRRNVGTGDTAGSTGLESTNQLPTNVIWNHDEGPGEKSAPESETQSLKEEDEEAFNLEQHWNEHANEIVDVALLSEKITQRAANMEQRSFHRNYAGVTTPTPFHTPIKERRRVFGNGHEDVSDMEDLAQPVLQDSDNDEAEQEQTEDQNDNEVTNMGEKEKIKLTLQADDGQDRKKDVGGDEGNANGMENEYCLPLRDPSKPLPNITDEEPAAAQFYQALDEIMARKRKETVESLFTSGLDWKARDKDEDNDADPTLKARLLYPQSDQDATIRSAVRSRASIFGGGLKSVDIDKKNVETTERPNRPPTPLEEALDRYTVLLGLFLGCLAILATVWFCFGCYGMYIYFFATKASSGSAATLGMTTTTSAPAAQEIVVRIVREVVHMTPNGQVILEKTDTDNVPLVYNAEDIAACVVNGIK